MQCNQGTPGGLFVHLSQSAPRVPPNYPQARHYHANLQPSTPCSRIFQRYFCTISICISRKHCCQHGIDLSNKIKFSPSLLSSTCMLHCRSSQTITCGPSEPMYHRTSQWQGGKSHLQVSFLVLNQWSYFKILKWAWGFFGRNCTFTRYCCWLSRE